MVENSDSDWLKLNRHLTDMEKLADVIVSLESEEETLRLVISSLTNLRDQTKKRLSLLEDAEACRKILDAFKEVKAMRDDIKLLYYHYNNLRIEKMREIEIKYDLTSQ